MRASIVPSSSHSLTTCTSTGAANHPLAQIAPSTRSACPAGTATKPTRKPAATIERIEAFLNELREDRGGLIDLELRVYQMGPDLYARLRDQAHALTAEGEALLEAEAELLSAHRVIAHDGQRVYVRRGGSRTYCADIEVNQTGVVPVLNPVVNALNEGHGYRKRENRDTFQHVMMMFFEEHLVETD